MSVSDEVRFMLAGIPFYKGADLEEFQEALKLTNEDMANLFGFSRATYYRLKDRKDPIPEAYRGHLHCLRQMYLGAEAYTESVF